jgi:hypothetical protein
MLAHGALLIRDVPVARTGWQDYHASEVAGAVDDDTAIDAAGMVRVWRDERDVFAPASMGSFEGAPVVMRHPDGTVSPGNWSELAVGHVQNVRRQDDLLIGDLLIHDARGIAAIREHGWRATSAGYDASYVAMRDGRLWQRDIVANHIAILPPTEQARCGERCAVGDMAWNYGGNSMTRDQQVPPGYSVATTSSPGGNSGYSQRTLPPLARGGPEGGVFFPSGALGAQKGEGPVGGELLLEIDAPVSAILVIAHGNGKTGIYRVGTATNAMNAGRTLTKSDTFIADARHFAQVARNRAAAEQRRGKEWADNIGKFWQQQAARG